MESKKLQKQKMITGFASVSALIALANPQYVDGNLVINSGYVGTGGMTVAMVMGLVIGWLFSAYFKHGLFKKDSSLPSVVVVWFESILIIFVLILVCIIIGQNVDLFSLLEKVFSPLAAIGNTYLGFLLFYMIMALCYCCGLSAWTVWPIVCALYLTNIAANAAAVAAGLTGCGSVTSGKRIIRVSHAQSETHPARLRSILLPMNWFSWAGVVWEDWDVHFH